MSNLTPVDSPNFEPLRQSFEYDQLEAELKALFIKLFEDHMRAAERRLNLYGMPHLGDIELIESAMKDAGLAVLRRNTTRSGFLLKAARSRNPRRGLHFLRQYLQSVWPNVWMVEPLWHPIATTANYPADRTPLTIKDLGFGVTAEYDRAVSTGKPKVYRTDEQGKVLLQEGVDYTIDANGVATFVSGPAPTPLIHFLTSRIRVTLPVTTDNGLGLLEIAKAFRPTLPARLMLELRLSTILENIGETGGLRIANGACGVMPFTAIGTLMR